MMLFAMLLASTSPACTYLSDKAPACIRADRQRDARLNRLAQRVCGPEGTVDMDPRPGHPDGYPSCNRNGWNGRRYVERAATPPKE